MQNLQRNSSLTHLPQILHRTPQKRTPTGLETSGKSLEGVFCLAAYREQCLDGLKNALSKHCYQSAAVPMAYIKSHDQESSLPAARRQSLIQNLNHRLTSIRMRAYTSDCRADRCLAQALLMSVCTHSLAARGIGFPIRLSTQSYAAPRGICSSARLV